MRILVLCQYFYPEQFLINDIVPGLVNRGHDVTVLTGRPNYPDGKIKKGYKKLDLYKGAKVVRVYEISRSKGVIFNYLSYFKSASKKINQLGEFDLIFSYQLSPVFMAAPLLRYKKKHPNVKSLLYCLDIWPESFNSHMPIKAVRSAVAKYSRKIYQAYEKIAVTSRPFIRYLNEKNGIPLKRLTYIPQHAVGGLVDKDLSSQNKVKHFLFAGNLGKGQTLDVILKAFSLVEREFIMTFAGCGSAEEELKRLTKELHLEEKVFFIGQKTYDEMEDIYRQSDSLLISLRGNNEVGNTLPGKLQTYMSTGKPIFGAINGAAHEIIEESKCGECVGAGDYQGLAKIITSYIDNPQKYSQCGINGRDYFKKHFTFDIFMDSLSKEITNL